MPCYSPLKGWRAKNLNENGKRPIVFKLSAGLVNEPFDVPCGNCIGCRLERSRQWALRCVHEASQHEDNCFITLTYSDKYLPKNASLDVKHFQDFMKRLRKSIAPTKIRFFHCGEYGACDLTNPTHVKNYGISKLGRPHYHAIIFGYDFADKQLISERENVKLYTSNELSKSWPFGYNTVGTVTFESAAYVARYVTKKITGDAATDHYRRNYVHTGLSVDIKHEYTTMSRRPGIGKCWYDKFSSDIYPKDFITLRGKKFKPPKFYDRILEEEEIEKYEKIKTKRVLDAHNRKDDNTGLRLLEKEQVKKAQLRMLIRPLDEDKL